MLEWKFMHHTPNEYGKCLRLNTVYVSLYLYIVPKNNYFKVEKNFQATRHYEDFFFLDSLLSRKLHVISIIHISALKEQIFNIIYQQ